MNKRSSALILLAGVLAAPAIAARIEEPTTQPAIFVAGDEVEVLKIGSTVPATLELPDFEGNRTSFGDLRGKTVLLHFWSDRCPAEVHADPIFKQMEEMYADNKDVVLIGIASNQNELGTAPEEGGDYMAHYKSLRSKRDKVGYKHTILADHGNVASSLFQARSTPHCFAIDKEGVLQYAGALDDDPRGRKGDEATNYLVEAAKALQKGEKLAVTETKPYG